MAKRLTYGVAEPTIAIDVEDRHEKLYSVLVHCRVKVHKMDPGALMSNTRPLQLPDPPDGFDDSRALLPVKMKDRQWKKGAHLK